MSSASNTTAAARTALTTGAVGPARAILAAQASLILSVVLGLATTAQAGPGTPTEIDKDAARTLVNQGDEQLQAKEYEAALRAYQRADEIMGVPTTAIEVGRVQLLLGNLVGAQRAFLRAARYPQSPDEPIPFSAARAKAAALAEKISPRLAKMTIEVEGHREDDVLQLILDGQRLADASVSRPINPGEHELQVTAQGYENAAANFSLEEGESRTVTLRLKRIVSKPASGSFALPMVVSGFATGGVALILGAITGGLSLDGAADAKALCNEQRCPPAAEEPLTRATTLAHVSTVSFAVAGLGAAVGITGLVLAKNEEGDEIARLDIAPTGIKLWGSF